jgi:predicted nucleotide-binding protein
MAMKPELIDFFLQQIDRSNTSTVSGSIRQLFEHLATEVKDNLVYTQYETAMPHWLSWLDEKEAGGFGYDWQMPGSFVEAKQLAFSVYKKLALNEDHSDFLFQISEKSNLQEAIEAFNEMFLPYFTKALEDITNANPEYAKNKLKRVSGKTVFIIHGHDSQLRTELQLLLKTGGVPYVVLHEQADKGRTIIDKLIEESELSNFAIAILTPDDLLSNGDYRARQNVILEMGYFIGLLGKERVRLLVKGDIDIPSDLYGILYEKHDEAGAWKARLAKELIAGGIFVDLPAIIQQY